MSSYRIRPSKLQGLIFIPPSKSHTLRAILFALLAKGRSEIRHYLHSPDATAMIYAIRCLGAVVDIQQDRLLIDGVDLKLKPSDDIINAGNSGIVLRFIGALAALLPTYTIITGDHSIRHNRPVRPLLEGLKQLGAFAESMRQDGYAPIIIRGPLQPGTATLDGQDSQPVSGLLIACSFLPGPTTLNVQNPGEKPWIDLTLFWLRRFGIEITHQDYTRYHIPGNARLDAFSLAIPGDFSSAAFPIAAALVTDSELTIQNIDMQDCQGDKELIPALQRMGARLEIDASSHTLIVRKGSQLQGIQLDINNYIDALPILAVIACYAQGTTLITGAAIARQKESDRIHAIATELKKMGARLEERPDGLLIHNSPLKGATLASHHDHRIAMATAVAALGAIGESRIDGIECIAKTYPTFATDFQAIKAQLEVVHK